MAARRKRQKLARSRHTPPLPLPQCQIQKVVVEGGGSDNSLASKTNIGCVWLCLDTAEDDRHHLDPPMDGGGRCGHDNGGLNWAQRHARLGLLGFFLF